MKYDWIIIGGGLSGLAAGIRLAHFGAKVCIVEKHDKLGGLNSYYFRNGTEINTGLHAMTNFTVRNGPKSLPLSKLLRQLRISYDELELREQNYSQINFSETTLKFTNDFSFFESEILRLFPREIEGFRKLNSFISSFNEFDPNAKTVSAKPFVRQHIKDPLLADMIFCPLMFYGSSNANYMELSQFVIMFKSIFHQGFCKPAKGIRGIIDILEKRFTESGGELRLKCEVRGLMTKDEKVEKIELSDGEILESENILSSAGLLETMNLCDVKPANYANLKPGKICFLETMALFDKYPAEALNHNAAIIFFNNSKNFNYQEPAGIFDRNSGVICCPNNFKYKDSDNRGAPMLRLTMLTNHDIWFSAEKNDYVSLKNKALEEFPEIISHNTGSNPNILKIKLADVFTPKTIHRYTGHLNGAIYGTPDKVSNGMTHLKNLFICGTDQGLLGITGSMLSGISVANMRMMKSSV